MHPFRVLTEKVKTAVRLGVKAYWEYRPLFTYRRLTTTLDEVKVDRPIFLLGVQGGGLTLLSRMFQRHPQAVAIGGGPSFWVGNNEMDKQYIRALPEDFVLQSPHFQSPVFKEHMQGDEFDHPVFGRERNWVYACDDLVENYRRTEEDWTRSKAQALRQAVKESLRAYADPDSAPRFVDMSQTFILKIPLLRRIFTDAKFIVQTRNPYVTCLKEAHDTSYAWRRSASMETKLQLFAENWYNSYRYALQDLEGVAEASFIRYEDLVSCPAPTLKEALRTADLSFYRDMLPQSHHRFPLGAMEKHKWYPIREHENEKYLGRINFEQASLIEENTRPIAERFGYGIPVSQRSS